MLNNQNEGEASRLAVSPAEAAELLGVGLPKIYEMTRMEGFPAIRVGHRVLIPVEQLKIWLANQCERLE